jgi:hypothetical protein
MARRTVIGEDQRAHLATMDEVRRYLDRFWDASLTRFKEQAEASLSEREARDRTR